MVAALIDDSALCFAALEALVQWIVVTIRLVTAVVTVLVAVTPLTGKVHLASVGTARTVAVWAVDFVTPIRAIFEAVAPIGFYYALAAVACRRCAAILAVSFVRTVQALLCAVTAFVKTDTLSVVTLELIKVAIL